MAHEENRDVAAFDELADALLALLLEEDVADGEGLVDDEDIRLDDGRDCERDASDHAAGVVLERHVHEVAKLSEVDDVVEVGVDELLGIAEKRAVEVDVLACGELDVKARAKLDKRGDVAMNGDLALAGLER